MIILFDYLNMTVFQFFVYYIIAIVLTLLIEIPFVYFVMKYKNVKNIMFINVLTNTLTQFIMIFIGKIFSSTYFLQFIDAFTNTLIHLLQDFSFKIDYDNFFNGTHSVYGLLMWLILIVIELVFIPLYEYDFYEATTVYVVIDYKNNIKRISRKFLFLTYSANMLSFLFGIICGCILKYFVN